MLTMHIFLFLRLVFGRRDAALAGPVVVTRLLPNGSTAFREVSGRTRVTAQSFIVIAASIAATDQPIARIGLRL
ncbi:hypothetical protein SAMCCGM7_pC1867 (plasmid) [Sinorhizobium americanum CCGM7]|nr:hypothetical protein SAMCCGM7_pC1867 [Sinorhizobium americanum CCGM7]